MGRVGISFSDLNLMTLRDMVNAIIGFNQLELNRSEQRRNTIFNAARYHASNTAFGEKAGKAIAKKKFPWEKKAAEDKKPVSYSDMLPFLNSISKD